MRRDDFVSSGNRAGKTVRRSLVPAVLTVTDEEDALDQRLRCGDDPEFEMHEAGIQELDFN